MRGRTVAILGACLMLVGSGTPVRGAFWTPTIDQVQPIDRIDWLASWITQTQNAAECGMRDGPWLVVVTQRLTDEITRTAASIYPDAQAQAVTAVVRYVATKAAARERWLYGRRAVCEATGNTLWEVDDYLQRRANEFRP